MIALAWVLGVGTVLATVALHQRLLHLLHRSGIAATGSVSHARAAFLVLALFAGHVMEAQLFGVVMFASHHLGLGALDGADGRLVEYLYFSISTYTSLGMGDLAPVGHLRLLAGLEAVIGLVLIGWSASFLFAEHRALWGGDAPGGASDRPRSPGP